MLNADKLKQIKTELEKKLPEDTELPTQSMEKMGTSVKGKHLPEFCMSSKKKKTIFGMENEIKYLPLSTLNVTAIEQELFDVIDKKNNQSSKE